MTRPLASLRETRVGYEDGRMTPRDVLEQALERIAAREPVVRAFVHIDAPAARRAADLSTQRWREGRALGPLDGAIAAIKDIIETADMPTDCGSEIFSGRRTGRDADCVAALRAAGAVIIGKTVTTEFAIGRSGPTRNPHDRERTPGGSSSGSAAAVGDGMAHIALGTQTQGSVLRPASYCGAIGFKPQRGEIPLAGVHPLSISHDHVGVFARDPGDIADAFSVLSGQPTPAGARAPRRLVRLHLAGWNEVEAPHRAIFEAALDDLRARGVEIVDREISPALATFEAVLDRGIETSLEMVAYDMREPYTDYVARHPERIGPRIHDLVARSAGIADARYAGLIAARDEARRRVSSVLALENADGFVMPAASGPAPLGFEYTGSRTYLAYWSWLGLPAISLPVMQADGLPWGLQIAGGESASHEILSIAAWMMAEPAA